jgi:hypothetical protein
MSRTPSVAIIYTLEKYGLDVSETLRRCGGLSLAKHHEIMYIITVL